MSNYYLEHHGILGQKWGRKNGPPYPIDPEDHSASERKARWRQSLSGYASQTAKIGKKVAKQTYRIGKIAAVGATTAAVAEIRRRKAIKAEKEIAKMKSNPKKYMVDELEAKIKRLEIEKRYTDLRKQARGEGFIEQGAKAVSRSLANSIGDVTRGAATYALGSKLNSIFNESDSVRDLFGIKDSNVNILDYVGGGGKKKDKGKGGDKGGDKDGDKDGDKGRDKPKESYKPGTIKDRKILKSDTLYPWRSG